MNGSINVDNDVERNFTIYRGNSGTGKTALLAGRAIQANWHGKKVLWLSADFIDDHIRDIATDCVAIHDLSTLRQIMDSDQFHLYDMVVFDEIGRLDIPMDMLSAQCIADFRSRNKRDGQVRLCSLTVRRPL